MLARVATVSAHFRAGSGQPCAPAAQTVAVERGFVRRSLTRAKMSPKSLELDVSCCLSLSLYYLSGCTGFRKHSGTRRSGQVVLTLSARPVPALAPRGWKTNVARRDGGRRTFSLNFIVEQVHMSGYVPKHSITLKIRILMTVSIGIGRIVPLVTAYHYSIANQGRRFFLMITNVRVSDIE